MNELMRVMFVALMAGLAGVAGLAIPTIAGAQDGAIEWEPYHLELPDGGVDTLELGRLSVPERRGSGAGEVRLGFVRLPARTANPGAPIVYLDGGPGGSGVGLARVPAYYRLFDDLRTVADVILLSQRGTGISEPRLGCRLTSPLPGDVFTTRTRMVEAMAPSVSACVDTWRGRGVDLTAYNTEESADDLEALREALGVEQVSLLGFSYGTHLGLAAMRRHGSRIERAVLIGVEGLEHTYKLPSTGDLQLRHVSELVARDETTGDVIPDLYEALDTLLHRLDEHPVSLSIEDNDGERKTILLGGDGLRYLLRRDLGDTNDLPVIPAGVRLLLDGDDRLVSLLAQRRFREIGGVGLMGLLMDCGSGARGERLERIRQEEPQSLLGAMMNTWFPDVCAVLPDMDLGDDFRSRYHSGVETLFLSGTLDANTPPYQAEYVGWGWPNATHLVVDHAGHESIMSSPDVQAVIVDFFSGEDVSDRRVEIPPLDFLSPDEVFRRLRR